MKLERILKYAVLGGCVLISACQSEPVGVPVHAVNYTEDEITYRIVDPKDGENRAGGETINSFGAGGLMCCYTVPEKWQPGIKVELQLELWLTSQPNGPDGSPRRVKQSVTLDLPKPVDERPSELWVIRNPDGTFDLIACNCGPSHEKWPGKIKGMPIASKSHREKLIRRDLSEAEDVLQRFSKLKRELDDDPIPYAKENWEFRKEQGEASLLASYSGPNDQRYVEFLKKEADEMITYAEGRISRLKNELP
ncbi:DUF3304 domain-containing protein [Pseudoduganella sp.]|uniref:DUF3304 domain-containing protein n=1 Tax=Pseudoduganella sp. TaxID=1880898 RepID=UPI0035B28E69